MKDWRKQPFAFEMVFEIGCNMIAQKIISKDESVEEYLDYIFKKKTMKRKK